MSNWIDIDTDWAYWINPETMRMPRVKGRVPTGVVVLIKEREDLDGQMMIVTRYAVASSDGLEDLDGKKHASEKLAEQMLDYMRRTNHYPPNTHIKKSYKNGNIDLGYAAGQYDTFTIRFTSELIGEDPLDFLGTLGEFVEKEAPDESDDSEPWRVETAKSSRATCRTCGDKIEKGTLRLGEPNEFEGNVSYRWHHLACAAGRIREPEELEGFDELDDEQQEEVREEIEA